MKYFLKVNFGIVGTEACEVVDVNSKEEANMHARMFVRETAESFGYYYDEDICSNYDEVVNDDGVVQELDYGVELYSPEKHDMYL